MGRFPAPIVTQHCIACEQQTHFRSSLLSIRKIAIFQRERSDDRKCVCSSQAMQCCVTIGAGNRPIAMLEQCYNQSKPCRINVATLQYCAKNRRGFLSLVTSPLACMLGFPNSDHVIYSPGIFPFVFFTYYAYTCMCMGRRL